MAEASGGRAVHAVLAILLMWLLNRRVTREYRSGPLSNVILGASVLLFVVLAMQEIIGAIVG